MLDETSGKYTRREALGLMARAGAGLGLLGASGLLNAAPALATPARMIDRPLRVHHDASIGPFLQPYIDKFNEMYAPLRAEGSYVPQDYHAVTETQFLGGAVDYDVPFADPGYTKKWYRAGWIQSVDDFPGIADLEADSIDAALTEIELDGKMVALPYYVGTEHFFYNSEMLDKIGAKPPADWGTFIEVSRMLRDKGIVEYPFSPYWTREFTLIWYQFMAASWSEGAQALFDAKFNPVFETDPACLAVLNTWHQLYAEKLVPPDILSTSYGNTGNIFSAGRSAFIIRYQLELKNYNDPTKSLIAGKAKNALLPGKAHTTNLWVSNWFMTAATPDRDAAWQLLSFLGGKDKTGQYYTPKRLIGLDYGLGFCYKSLFDDPDIVASWGKWSDPAIIKAQTANSKTVGPVINETWYIEFTESFSVSLQKAVTGELSPQAALKEGADFVRSKVTPSS